MTTIRISDPLDLVTVVPYHLGFRPHRSLVVLGLRGTRLDLAQRLDLPEDPADCPHAAALLVGHCRSHGATAVVLVGYEERAGEARPALDAVSRHLAGTGIRVLDRIVVHGGRAYPIDAADRRLAHDGMALPAENRVAAVADYVAQGRVPVASREHLAALVAAEPGPLTERVAAVMALHPRAPDEAAVADPTERSTGLAAWGRFLDVTDARWFGRRPPGPATVARMLDLLRDHAVRDLLVAWLAPGSLGVDAFDPPLVRLAALRLPGGTPWRPVDGSSGRAGLDLGEREGRLRTRLCWLARHSPPSRAPAGLALLASFAWHHGEGALARVALDRALAIDPDYRLAVLLERVVELGIRPGGRAA
jgi:hypothetical protein